MKKNKRSKVRKAVFFDAGGTLFRVYPSVGYHYSQAAGRYGLKISAPDAEESFRREFHKMAQDGSRSAHSSQRNEKRWWREIVQKVFIVFGKIQRFDAFFEELYALFAEPEVWRLYPDVLPVLRKLRDSQVRMGIVSNWDLRLLTLTRKMGVDPYMDFVLASALVGSAKPDPAIFLQALNKSGCQAQDVVHVGDRYDDDVVGARQAGIRPLLLCRKGARVKGVETIRSLTEIHSLLLG